jgi:hypothetical protein
MHFSSPHRLLPLAQSTPVVSHPPYEVRSELGAWGTYLRQCARTRPWRRTEARTASGGLLQGAARCHGRLRTWRSRLCPQLSQEDASARQRQGELLRPSVTVLVDGYRACVQTFDLYTMNLGFFCFFSKMTDSIWMLGTEKMEI